MSEMHYEPVLPRSREELDTAFRSGDPGGIHDALINMGAILNGLTRGLDLGLLDRGFGEQFGTRLSFYPATRALGVIMPSNSPAVNSLWLPAIPLK